MRQLDAELLETLLQAEEGTALDHKSQQYKFAGASDAEKAELLKDVMAMANAWKTSEAYIVVGAKENPGGRALVLGVTEHVDDAKLQQFVNEKTSVPVEFSYEAVIVDGKMLGVFTIAHEQQRPIWLKKDFAHLKAQAVYLRRGSSTTIANPDEIARMGEARVPRRPTSSLRLGIGDSEDPSDPEASFAITSTILLKPTPRHSWEPPAFAFRMPSEPTGEQMYEWNRQLALLQVVSVHVRNVGQAVASDVRVELAIKKENGLGVCDEESLPQRPAGRFNLSIPSAPSPQHTYVKDFENHWLIVAHMGKVQPGGTVWSDPFYLGSHAPLTVAIEARILADEIPAPQISNLSVSIATTEAVYEEELDDDDT